MVAGTIMAITILWQHKTAYLISPFMYTLLYSTHNSLREPQVMKDMDDVLGRKWESWPQVKPVTNALTDATSEVLMLIAQHYPVRQATAYADASVEEWADVSEHVLANIAFMATPAALHTCPEIKAFKMGSDLVVSPLTGTTFNQVYTATNGHALTKQMLGGLLPSPDILIDQLKWKDPSQVVDAHAINDSASDTLAEPFRRRLDAYLRGVGHPESLIHEGVFPKQVDLNDKVL
ncbi:hypothetical protein V5O48_017042 [Marasmius crinis-equi]|uniref:Uncharacterized protein n=1 Tax=Marasmius crinis-equi TaxID=585013 RepID=A0ABR3EQ25_9AGAR